MNKSSNKPWWRRWFGSRSERAAERYLRRLGYGILARNFRCPVGEIDLIAVDRACVVFVEVRSTGVGETDRPAASVDPAKQRQLTRLALWYLKQKRLLEHSARFDVVAISWPEGAKAPHIEHFQNAFEATGEYQFYS
jgi:putative endonuclease